MSRSRLPFLDLSFATWLSLSLLLILFCCERRGRKRREKNLPLVETKPPENHQFSGTDPLRRVTLKYNSRVDLSGTVSPFLTREQWGQREIEANISKSTGGGERGVGQKEDGRR